MRWGQNGDDLKNAGFGAAGEGQAFLTVMTDEVNMGGSAHFDNAKCTLANIACHTDKIPDLCSLTL